MVRVLALSDEVSPVLWSGAVRRHEVDLVLAAGDLPFDYLEHVTASLDRPCVLVPGNHDPDLSRYRNRRGVWFRAGMPARWPGPAAAQPPPNQWTQAQQARRAWGLRLRAALTGVAAVDIVLTHAPPRHCGDREDPAHRGFECLHGLVRALRPSLLVHGHIHPYGTPVPDRLLGATLVVNVVGHRVLDVRPVRHAA